MLIFCRKKQINCCFLMANFKKKPKEDKLKKWEKEAKEKKSRRGQKVIKIVLLKTPKE